MNTLADDAPWADLADFVVTVAREIQTHGFPDDVVELVGSEQMVIRYIHRNPGSSPSDVAVGTGLQRSNLSAALRTLEARGLVERRPDPSDARRVQLWHTAAADANLDRLRAARSALIAEALGDEVDPVEGARVLRLLERVEAGLTAGRRAAVESAARA
ncbi:DNA-binding MarR family transcriptional regulator [Frondihabitans sp. PhB188]|uniref:MarR family winged helix-turn-helix transcriptional regulator n=1 Tax=Frondihabitans sp. PhB188 TaxID=2485200 RepID=UPI000FAABA74|nr:MarR family winged helix-turn-helix transcriptional regulator [Frondihabitans sp. PhB188]ROQ40078.1 DNA-binding MarR family transcriptional regulator [Frondihabitans sp. PhB188]